MKRKHLATQFDLPGAEAVFNLAGEQIAPEASTAPAMMPLDYTDDLFPVSKPNDNEETKTV